MIPKFRGRSVEAFSEEEWKYGYLIEDEGYSFIINQVIEANEQYITIGSWCPVNPDTLGQSTGLFDKNNTEIFEGDIVRVLDSTYTVFYDNERGSYRLKPHDDRWNVDYMSNFSHGGNFEVVGNIYENKEYL